MPAMDRCSLWAAMNGGRGGHRALFGRDGSASLAGLASGTSLGGRLEELRGCAVLLGMRDQLTAALALIELDGVVSRLVLCSSDLAPEHLPFLMGTPAPHAV